VANAHEYDRDLPEREPGSVNAREEMEGAIASLKDALGHIHSLWQAKAWPNESSKEMIADLDQKLHDQIAWARIVWLDAIAVEGEITPEHIRTAEADGVRVMQVRPQRPPAPGAHFSAN
jgi:hypothetical protein